jgi:uncharacterized membrane protein
VRNKNGSSRVVSQGGEDTNRNVTQILEIEQRALEDHSRIERVSAAVSRITGSLPFFIVHVIWFGVWIVVNLGLTPLAPFDAYPFSFLTMTVSLEAIFLTNFVLMAQNLQTRDADRRSQLNLQVDLLAEQESTATLRMVAALCRNAKIEVPMADARLRELLCDTDLEAVADKLKEGLEEQP